MDKPFTLKISKEGKDIYFFNRGVKDLYNIILSNPELIHGSTVTDKAIGKAAAALITLGKAKKVITPVVSSLGLSILNKHNIDIEYDKEVPILQNWSKNGPCPLESRCKGENDIITIFGIIKRFIQDQQTASI